MGNEEIRLSKSDSQVTHSLRDSAGRPLMDGKRYLMTSPGCKPVHVIVSEDNMNFDVWFRPVGQPDASPQRVDELAADVELELFE
jgi:hypothetical protein